MRKTLSAVVLMLIVAGCGSDGSPQQGANFGNLFASPAGLILVQQEHPTGWGHPDCFACHEVRDIHTVNRTGLPDCPLTPPATPAPCVDLADIRSIVRDLGEASCTQCHGTNGVQP